jgi:hypothetical protein
MACLGVTAVQAQQPPPPPASAQPQPSQPPRRARVVTKLQGFELIDTAKIDKQTTVAGASRGTTTALAVAPRLGRVYAVRPTLTWTIAGPADATFTVRVYNEDEEVVHEATVNERRYAYRGPSLKAGKIYYWTVELMSPDTRSPMTGMRVVDAGERADIARQLEAVAGEDEAAHLARARVFVEHRVWYDALAETDAAIAASPASAAAHEQRGLLLAQLPALQALADAEFARADALARVR